MQPSSLTRLQHMVKSTGDTISLPALKDYLEYMQDAYLFFPIPNLVSPMTEQATLQKDTLPIMEYSISFCFREKRSCWRIWWR